MVKNKGIAFSGTTREADKIDRDILLGGENSVGRNGAGWFYCWSPLPQVEPPDGVEFVPMLWNASQEMWTMLINNYDPGYTGWIMGPNEPNHPKQANMSPVEAAICWNQLKERYPLAKLVSPACWDRPIFNKKSSKWEQQGDHWLSAWMHEYWLRYNCMPNPDAYGIHHYSDIEPARAVQRFYDEWLLKNDDRPEVELWLTEFAIPDEQWRNVLDNDLAKHVRKEINTLKKIPRFTRYAWFSNREYPIDPVVSNPNSHIALNSDDGLTGLGKAYLSVE